MKIIKAPHTIATTKNENKKLSVFLAGSIESGTAQLWQERICQHLQDYDIDILNPRRDHWDHNWKQSIDNKQFKEQVEWELRGLEYADIIALYFDPQTKSPISLLELGLFAKSKKMIVFCTQGFWRKGNIDIVCEQNNIPCFDNEINFITFLKKQIELKT